jgi:Replication initiator protein A
MQNYCCALDPRGVTIASRLRPKQNTAPEQQELIPRDEAAPARPLEVIKIEKNLNSLGFFTPSHKGLDNKKSKSISISREDRGRKMQARATIFPSPDHGLPTTADQDKYFAFQKIVTEIKKRTGLVANPIGFTSYQLLKILGVNASGKNYEEVGQWLERMTLTGIRSENMVYFAGRKVWAKDIFHVFDRAVQVGQELPDGKKADQNYVWLSDWQLENLNANYVLPLDLHTYRQLRSSIAKALVPLLQIWFFASGRRPIEKRYGDLCQYLQIRRWPHLSKVRENFAPALEELRNLSFLELWDIQRTADNLDFKIVLHPGHRYSRDFRLRLAGQEPGQPPHNPELDALLKELTSRGIREDTARHLLLDVPANQCIEDQLEWGDYLVHCGQKGKFFNPAGFLVYLIRNNIEPPPHFETARRRELRRRAEEKHNQDRAAQAAAQLRELRLAEAYREYQDHEIETYMQRAVSPEEMDREVKRIRKDILKDFRSAGMWPEETQKAVVMQKLKRTYEPRVPLLSLEEFCQRSQMPLLLTPAET